MLKKIVLLFAALALAKAQIPGLGWCPDYVPMADFDMNRFLGKWYETEKYFQVSEIGSRCLMSNYTKGPDGKLRVFNEITSRLTGVKRIIEGEIKPPATKSDIGKLHVKYSNIPLIPEANYVVLKTDYDNYAVLHQCQSVALLNAQNVWVMTRKRFPPGEVLQLAYGVLDQYQISRRFFVKSDQEECSYEAPEPVPAPAPAPAPAQIPVAPPAPAYAQSSASAGSEPVPVKEEPVIANAETKKSFEGVHLRSATILEEAKPIDENRKEETEPEKSSPVEAEKPAPEVLQLGNPEPVEPTLEKEPVEEVKPQDLAFKAIAPESVPEVILKNAESVKKSAQPIEEPQSGANAVAEESKTVEVIVPAELPAARPVESDPLDEPAKPVEHLKSPEPVSEILLEDPLPVEEPKPIKAEEKLPEKAKPVEVPVAPKIEEAKPVEESKPALKSPETAEIPILLPEAEPAVPNKIESLAPAEPIEISDSPVLLKSVPEELPVKTFEEEKIADVPAAPKAPEESEHLKSAVEIPEAPEQQLPVVKPAAEELKPEPIVEKKKF